MTPEELYYSNEKLATATLHKMFDSPENIARKNNMEYEDLLQYAKTGLWKAAVSYKSDKCKFSTHAINNIRWHVMERFRREGRLFKMDRDKNYKPDELYGVLSLDKQCPETGFLYHEQVASDVNVEDDVLLAFSDKGMLYSLLNILNEKEKTILKLKIENKTSRQIGEILGMTHQNVSVYYKKIRNKTERYLNEREVV